jgi:hypothetical protein
MKVEQHFHAPVGKVVGMQSEEQESRELTHEEWLKEHQQDQEFIKATRIAVTRPERLLLQRLICLGARHEHIRELWDMHLLLRQDAGELVIKRPRWLVWAGAGVFVSMAAAALPLAAQAILLSTRSPLWFFAFAMFVASIAWAGWCSLGFIRPWRLVKRLQPLVDQVNRTTRAGEPA